MASEEDRSYVRKVFPEVELIGDRKLAEAVENIWVKAWKASKWERIEDAGFGTEAPNFSLAGHTRVCTRGVVAVADAMTEIHGLKLDRDQLLVLALLHDVSKIIEYEPGPGGKPAKSEIGKKITHGIFSGIWAREEGLSLDMVHLLFTHSGGSKMLPGLLEGVVLAHVDHADADALLFSSGAGRSLIHR